MDSVGDVNKSLSKWLISFQVALIPDLKHHNIDFITSTALKACSRLQNYSHQVIKLLASGNIVPCSGCIPIISLFCWFSIFFFYGVVFIPPSLIFLS